MDIEEWRPVVGWEGYYSVSDLGRVRSDLRTVTRPGPRGNLTVRGRILRPSPHRRTGYIEVNLWRAGTRTRASVHTLVLTAFTGPRPDELQGRHLNGDQNNNTLANLEWGTGTENQLDSVRHGTHHFARRTHCPRRHRLVAPNLVACLARKGYRDCLACNRARTAARNARVRHGIELDWRALADRNYRRMRSAGSVRSVTAGQRDAVPEARSA